MNSDVNSRVNSGVNTKLGVSMPILNQPYTAFAGMAKERVRYPTLGEEGADEDGGIKDGAWHGRGDTL